MICLENVSKNYGKNNIAIDNLSFKISDGETLSIIGPIGAGKTTLLRILAGLIEPSSGAVNCQINKYSVGYMPATEGLIYNLSVLDNLNIWAGAYNVSRSEVSKIIEMLKLSTIIKKKVSQLSSGLRIMTSFACSVLGNSRIILLDEPFVHLDVGSAIIVKNYIDNELKNNVVIISSHNLEFIDRISDTFLIIDKGKMKYHGSAAQLRSVYSDELVSITFSGAISKRDKKFLEGKYGFNFISNEIVYVNVKKMSISGALNVLKSYKISIDEINEHCTQLQDIYFKILQGEGKDESTSKKGTFIS